jgi:hypothetical protein
MWEVLNPSSISEFIDNQKTQTFRFYITFRCGCKKQENLRKNWDSTKITS